VVESGEREQRSSPGFTESTLGAAEMLITSPRGRGLPCNCYLAAVTDLSIQFTQLTFLHCRKHPTSLQAHSKTSVQLGTVLQPQRSRSQ
jgi:hypothetical protein